MKIKELKSIIDQAYEYSSDVDADVLIVVGKKGEYEISTAYQGGVIPTLYLHVGEKTYDATKW